MRDQRSEPGSKNPRNKGVLESDASKVNLPELQFTPPGLNSTHKVGRLLGKGLPQGILILIFRLLRDIDRGNLAEVMRGNGCDISVVTHRLVQPAGMGG